MKAVTVVESGVQIIDVDTPSPKDTEVLVKVHACGLNRADLVVADGGAHGAAGGPGTIVGMEFSGEIIKCGEHVKNLSIGDRVMCSGASVWAEYAIADYGRVIKIPNNNMDFATASTLPIALATMHNALVTIGNFSKGQTILIQGASSGVGLMGLQIAKHLGAKLVIGTSTKPEKFDKLKDAIKKSNDSDYGLSATLWAKKTKNNNEILSRIECGRLWLNGSIYQNFPFLRVGGLKSSGNGRVAGIDSINNYSIFKTLIINE